MPTAIDPNLLSTQVLALALNRASIVPFTQHNWMDYAGAEGDACMVHFRPEDAAMLAAKLGIGHWLPEMTAVVLDSAGLTWNGSSPVNSYAWGVGVEMVYHQENPGTPAEYWEVADRYAAGSTDPELLVAGLPQEFRTVYAACPPSARPYVLKGYLQQRAEQEAAAGVSPLTSEQTREVRALGVALAAMEEVDFSVFPGLYDAVPWASLEQAATINPVVAAEGKRPLEQAA